MKAAVLLLALLASGAVAKATNASYFANATRPLVLAHRGASGVFPEHTLGGYTSAYFYGADFLELDL